MSGQTIAIVGLVISLLGATFGFGLRIGTLSERLDAQTKRLELMNADLDAINRHFIEYTLLHRGGDE